MRLATWLVLASWVALSPMARATPTPAPTSSATTRPAFAEVITTPQQYELRTRDKARLTEALRAIDEQPTAFIGQLPDPASSRVLILGGRPAPYALDDLVSQFPEALTALDDSSILVTLPIVVGPGSTLVIDSSRTPVVRFVSGAQGYATLVAVDAAIITQGSPLTPVSITSYEPNTGQSDSDIADGRAYVVAFGGRMQLDYTVSSGLGFLLGETSGVAWMSRQGRPATGGARGSAFTGNYFGAYASGADGLLFSDSNFSDNTIYGFDPHTGTTNTVVENSQAARNGRHGFIFSDDCRSNVIRNSQSYLNGGAGFVIDDGSDDADGPPRPSSYNRLESVSARDNGATGIVIEGGTSNTVSGAEVVGNPTGLWVKNAAVDTAVTATTITTSETAGIRLNDDTVRTSIRDSALADDTLGVWIDGAQETILHNVSIDNSERAAISVSGDPSDTSFSDVVVTGTGQMTAATPGGQTSGVQLTGVDTSGWRTNDPPKPSDLDYTMWVKLVPVLAIVVAPVLLWIPYRWRWRREQAARFKGAA